VVLKRPFDELVEDIGRDKFIDARAREVICEELQRIVSLMCKLAHKQEIGILPQRYQQHHIGPITLRCRVTLELSVYALATLGSLQFRGRLCARYICDIVKRPKSATTVKQMLETYFGHQC
jgi:hypothetical protein